jgi:hypothetical protein
MYENGAMLAVFLLIYSAVAGRIERSVISGPIVFTAAGFILGADGLGILRIHIDGEGLRLLAELTLAMVLFTDAANADFSIVKRNLDLPERLLLIGLPQTIVLGFVIAAVVFPRLEFGMEARQMLYPTVVRTLEQYDSAGVRAATDGADEEGTLERLKACVANWLIRKSPSAAGASSKTTGTGWSSSFRASSMLVCCAIGWQCGMAECHAGEPADGRIDFRIGSSPAVPARQRRGTSTSRSGLPELDRADLKLRNLLAG